jgi:cholesterol transport system auxiliary component
MTGRRAGPLRALRALAACALAVALTGCTFNRPESGVPTRYDLGPPRAYARTGPGVPGTILVPSVRAPESLDDNGIVYRLMYEDPSQTRVYALNKWVSEPAALITDRLRARLAAASKGVVAPGFGARSDYTLRVDLEDFSQNFKAPSESEIQLRARASLLDSESHKLLAQRVFDLDRPAEPNAPGAVKALTAATDTLLEDLVKWVTENAKPRQ